MTRWDLWIDGQHEYTTDPRESYVLYFKGQKARRLGKKVRFTRTDHSRHTTEL